MPPSLHLADKQRRGREGGRKGGREGGRKEGRKIETNDTANKSWEGYKKEAWRKRQSINIFLCVDVLYITPKIYGLRNNMLRIGLDF